MTLDATTTQEGAPDDRPVRYADTTLAARAARVLRDNDTGAVIAAAPQLYPHMWSWDTAFISIGLAHLDVRRAIAELDTLFAAQWRNGMVPHIVFTEDDAYFPGPERWGTEVATDGSAHVRTSGICQPPVHAIAVRRVLDIARKSSPGDRVAAEGFARRIWPALYAWHRWLVEYRTPGSSGLIAIVHGWESGMDNSPRWDRALARVEVAKPGPYTRVDTSQLGDPSQRPTDWDYDRYLWLVGLLRKYRYDDTQIYRQYPHFKTEVLAASIRHSLHVIEAAKLGTHVATLPPNVLRGLFKHVLTDNGLKAFLDDWKKTGQSIL